MAESSETHVFPDFAELELSLDDLLECDPGLDDGLPDFDPDDVLGLHAKEGPTEDLWGAEASDAEMESTNQDDALHLQGREAVEVILCLNVSLDASSLQEPLGTEPSSCYTTSETTPGDDAQMTDEIDFPVTDIEHNSNDSGRWSMEVDIPDDAEWCMSNVPDWEPGFNAWCSAHHGPAFHRMLPHCVTQCTTCLAMFSLTSNGFWYSQNSVTLVISLAERWFI